MFKNRHVMTALLVTPLLAILAWFTVGSVVGEKPAPAQEGRSYPMVAQSNCRWASGACDVKNNDLHMTLSYEGGRQGTLALVASHSLESALVAVAITGESSEPAPMTSTSADGKRWQLPMDRATGDDTRLQLVVTAGGAHFFAETSVSFFEKTSLMHGQR